jgi:F-type H+-transporting ATPase subunit gamma
MANNKTIKNRIKSIKNTKKITKAMELVAASKMKRAVSQTLASRLYAGYSWEILTSLSERLEEITHKFFIENEKVKKDLLVLITSNRGLCGGYNSQVIKKTIAMLKEFPHVRHVDNHMSDMWDIVTVGKKGDNAMRRIGQNVMATFIDFPVNISLRDIIPLSTYITDEFKKENYGKIYIAYTDFVSALSQKPKIRKLLPISKISPEEGLLENSRSPSSGNTRATPYLFEGETEKLLETLAEKLVRMQIYQMLLESNASEQSSRMVAMKNASEAAGEMIDDLTLAFNKARQAGITKEISEISAGMASVS